MLKLLYAAASPYSCKVRMAAAHLGIELELVPTETANQPQALMQANPLGKIPVLLLENGEALFDSRTITHYFDRAAGGRLYPGEAGARTRAEVLEALCDGMCDALLAHVYERRYRPENLVHQPWLERQWSKAEAALKFLEKSPPVHEPVDAGKLALRAALGYLNFRFKDQWEVNAPRLLDWAATFDHRFPGLAELVPRSAPAA